MSRVDSKGQLASVFSSFLFSLLAVAALVVSVERAAAFPLTSEKAWNPALSATILADGFTYNGITALSNCSGSFVKFKGASLDARGLILTNGHCTGGGIFGGGMPQPGEVIYRRAQSFGVSLLRQDGSRIAGLRATSVLYGTMTDTDVALLELNQTYRQIESATGVQPLVMADQMTAVGTMIDIPSGYWKRTYSCQIESVVHVLKEGNWRFTNSVRYSPVGCEVVGGTSGSPILSPATGEVIAINNTGNESGQSCTVNNPCEIDSAGNVTVIKGRGYGQQTYTLYSCLNAKAEFDLDAPGCVLPKGH